MNINELIAISEEAGKAIMEIYSSNFDYQIKDFFESAVKALEH